MKSKNLFPIRYVVTQTGLTPHQIRVWERRFNVVSPQRTDSNQRMYCEEDVKHLQLLKKAVECGHSISRVAKLPTVELLRLINRKVLDAASSPSRVAHTTYNPDEYCEISLAAVKNLDNAGLETILDQATVHLTKIEVITGVIEPLFHRIGDLWRKGELKIVNEHMATNIVRAIMWDLIRSTISPENAPRVLVATPAGDPYELGALSTAIVACEAGWHPLYFGPNLPAEELAAATIQTGGRAVTLSITKSLDTLHLKRELRKLRRYLGSDTTIFIGGQNASACADFLDEIGLQFLASISELRSSLESLDST